MCTICFNIDKFFILPTGRIRLSYSFLNQKRLFTDQKYNVFLYKEDAQFDVGAENLNIM